MTSLLMLGLGKVVADIRRVGKTQLCRERSGIAGAK
jgi:hypothetical protein